MPVSVTKHAIKRYRERLFDHSSPDEDIVSKIKEVVKKGTLIRNKAHFRKTCSEIYYKGISVVAIKEPNKQVVVTCLGDAPYRKWLDNQRVVSRIK